MARNKKPAGACNVCTRATWDASDVGKVCGRPLPNAPIEFCPGKIVAGRLELDPNNATRRMRRAAKKQREG